LLGASLFLGGVYVLTADPDDPVVRSGSAFELGSAREIHLLRRVDERAESVRMAKRDGIWWVTDPFEAEADPDVVFGVLDAVASVGAPDPLPAGDPADFGLAPPQVEATVTLADGSTRELILGRKAPVGVQTYIQRGSDVAVVDGHPGDLLAKRANEYRDHKIFRYAPGDVTRVRVASALGVLEATETAEGWFLTDYGPVDLDALDDWIVDLTRLRVDLFLDLDHETIDEPRFTVEVETPAGVQRLLVGRDTPYGPLVFFGDGLDGVVDPGLLAMLERGPTDVGRSSVFPFAPDRTARVEVVGERVVEPPFDLADPFVGMLRDAQYTYRRDPPAWTTVDATVIIEGPRGATLDVGPVDDEGFRPVRQQGSVTALRVPADELAPLFSGSEPPAP
jgi:hypothetical protein